MGGIRPLWRPLCSSSKILRWPASRSFAAAALQYDSDYMNGEEASWLWKDRLQFVPGSDAQGMMLGGGVQWVVMGSPGLKKHVYAGRLADLLQVPHISMGSLVRQELSPRSALYKQIAKVVNEGKLVPEDIIFELLSHKLDEGYCRGESGFILDGIPKTRIQAEILDQIADIDLVVNFKCNEECALKKQFGGAMCSHCGQSLKGQVISITSLSACSHQPPSKSSAEGLEAVHKEKFRIYNEQKQHLEDYYRRQQKLLDFTVAGEIGETWRGLLAALHLQHMVSDLHSPQKLTE